MMYGHKLNAPTFPDNPLGMFFNTKGSSPVKSPLTPLVQRGEFERSLNEQHMGLPRTF